MGDEEVGQAEVVLQVVEQVDDLRLDRHVERADGLVEDDELGLERERAGDPDALALPAGELVREAAEVLALQADAVQQLGRARRDLRLVDAVQRERRADDLADPLARVQRRERVLEDHLHLAPDGLELRAAGLRDVGAAEADRAAGRVEQAHERARQRRLAAARLADEAERLALAQVQRDVVDGVHVGDRAVEQQPLLDREVLLEVVGGEQDLRRRRGRRRAVAAAAAARGAALISSPRRPRGRSGRRSGAASPCARARSRSGPRGPSRRTRARAARAWRGRRRGRAGSAGGSGSPAAHG